MKKLVILVSVLCLVPMLLLARHGFRFDHSWAHGNWAPRGPRALMKKEVAWSCEKASYAYILSYQAFLTAKNQKKTNSHLIGFLHNYREAYAVYLKQVHELGLATPRWPQDPAGEFNATQSKYGTSDDVREWSSGDIKTLCRQVADKVNAGETPEKVKEFIKEATKGIEFSYAPNDIPRCEFCKKYRMKVRHPDDAKERLKLCPGLRMCACKGNSKNIPYDPDCPCCQKHLGRGQPCNGQECNCRQPTDPASEPPDSKEGSVDSGSANSSGSNVDDD